MSDGIKIKKSHQGMLHHELHVKEGKEIPLAELQAKLAAAKRDGNTEREKQLVFAINARHFHHNKGGGNP